MLPTQIGQRTQLRAPGGNANTDLVGQARALVTVAPVHTVSDEASTLSSARQHSRGASSERQPIHTNLGTRAMHLSDLQIHAVLHAVRYDEMGAGTTRWANECAPGRWRWVKRSEAQGDQEGGFLAVTRNLQSAPRISFHESAPSISFRRNRELVSFRLESALPLNTALGSGPAPTRLDAESNAYYIGHRGPS